MSLTKFSAILPGRHVRLAGHTDTGIIIRKSRYVPSVLVRWRGGTLAWEEYYRLELI